VLNRRITIKGVDLITPVLAIRNATEKFQTKERNRAKFMLAVPSSEQNTAKYHRREGKSFRLAPAHGARAPTIDMAPSG
jgi:hypothetical protein